MLFRDGPHVVFEAMSGLALERGLEAETFPRGQVCGEDDFLNVLVGELIDIELARQPPAPASSSCWLRPRRRAARVDAGRSAWRPRHRAFVRHEFEQSDGRGASR